jgi:hypothetical protein
MAPMDYMPLLLFCTNTGPTCDEQPTHFLWLVRADTSWVAAHFKA